MSAYPPTGPDRPDRPDELGDLLSAGLERDLGRPVDTVRLLEGARVGAVRLRRRRRAYGAATAVLLVAAVPFGMTRMTGLLGTTGVKPPAAHDTLSPEPTPTGPTTAPVDVPPERYTGDLAQLVGASKPLGVTVDVPLDAILLPRDAGPEVDKLLTVRGRATDRSSGVWDTVDRVCDGQPGGLQWNLKSTVRVYDEPPGTTSTTPGWELKTVVRALTVFGAQSQLRWLQRNLESCATNIGTGHWTLQPAVDVGNTQVLATIEDGSAVVAVGVVRVGAATSGFCLRVPGSAGSASARQLLAVRNGQALLAQAAARLTAADVSGEATAALGRLMHGTPTGGAGTGAATTSP